MEDLPKRVNFKVPDGYFDDLPGRIQNRVASAPKTSWWSSRAVALRVALPVITLLTVGIFWYMQSTESVYEKLGDIDEAQLAWFVDDQGTTIEELIEGEAWTTEELDALEDEVFSTLDASGDGLDVVVDDLELENF